MLFQLRTLAGNLGAKLLLAVLVLSFAVWGIGDMVRGPGPNRTVAKIGSQKIPLGAYERAYQRETENLRRSLGSSYSPEVAGRLGVPTYVLHTMINRALLEHEGRDLRLAPGDATIAGRIRNSPGFQDEHGKFDKRRFQAALSNIGLSEQNYVEQLRRETVTDLIAETLAGAGAVPEAAVRVLYDAQGERREATLYRLSFSLAGDIDKPDEAELAAYHNDHATEFTAPEYRSLTYVVLRPADMPGKVSVAPEDLRTAYKERIEEFRKPERRTVEQLLYGSEKEARQVDQQLKSGASFRQVAKDIPPMNKNALSLGTIERGNIIEAAADKVFSISAGETTEPVQSSFGWHIFRVTSIKPAAILPFEEARPSLEKELRQNAQDEAFHALTNRIEDALAGGSTLKEAAQEFGLKAQTLGPIDREGNTQEGQRSQDVPDLNKFMDAAFATDEKGTSPLTPAKNGAYYIVSADSVTPERVKTLDEVRGRVIAGWEKEQRKERLRKLTETIVKQFTEPKSRKEAIAKYRLQAEASDTFKRTDQPAGFPPSLVADIFSRVPGESTGAHPLKNGEYMMAVAGGILPATPPGQDNASRDAMNAMRGRLQTDVRNEIIEQYMRYLAEKYPVSIDNKLLESVVQ